jgi:phosphatidylglycerophosphatase A
MISEPVSLAEQSTHLPPVSSPLSPLKAAPVLRPGVKFLCSHPAHFMALAAGAGLSPKAPGTVGTLWAWAAFAVMQLYLSTAQIGAVIGVSLLLGWWACTVAAKHLRVSFLAQCVAFVLFRFFDAVKPGPVAWADDLFHGFGWKGGFGIVFDDLVAAGCTLLVIALWRF